MAGDDALGGEIQDGAGEDGIVLRRGEVMQLTTPAELLLEDGTVLGVVDVLPPGLPAGRYELHFLDQELTTSLVVLG